MSVFAPLDPIPQTEPPVEGVTGRFAGIWYRFFSQLVARSVLTILRVANPVHRTNVAASIVATTLFLPAQTGDFRISWFAHVAVPASVSSSIAVTIGWKSNGVACSKTFAAQTGNTTATADGDSVFIRADSGVAVTYSSTYISVGTAMQYDLDVYAESVPS